VLREQPYKTKGLVDWDFTAVSMLDAIETLVSCWGDVAFRERFSPGSLPRVLIDFYRIGDATSTGRKTVSVPSCGSLNQIGIEDLSGSGEVGDRIDRVILVGGQYKNMITCWTGDTNIYRRLRKGWISKQLTLTQTHFDQATNAPISREVTKSVEEWVLDDPDYGKRGSDLFHPDCEFVYRRYLVPLCLLVEGLTIEKENAVRKMQQDPSADDPKRLEQQVFGSRTRLAARSTKSPKASWRSTDTSAQVMATTATVTLATDTGMKAHPGLRF
jgi:hypothetical protein